MVQTSARLLRLLSLLQSRRFWAGADLARELEVTERSVRRDVDRLRSLGYPVHAAAGVGGGYQMGAGKELPPLPLEDEEAVAVAIGLRVAATGPIRGLEEASVRALAKLEQVLPRRLRKRINSLNAVSVQLGDAGPTLDATTLATIANAARDQELLRFEFARADGSKELRTVEPYRVVHSRSRWYLLAFDPSKGAWRTFRVDRIHSPEAGRPFKPRALPTDDVAAYVSQQVSTDAYPVKARVTLHAPAKVVAEKVSAISGRIEAIDDHRCTVHTGGQSLESLAFHLAWMGFEFEVHEPPELIRHLQNLSDRLARAAARG